MLQSSVLRAAANRISSDPALEHMSRFCKLWATCPPFSHSSSLLHFAALLRRLLNYELACLSADLAISFVCWLGPLSPRWKAKAKQTLAKSGGGAACLSGVVGPLGLLPKIELRRSRARNAALAPRRLSDSCCFLQLQRYLSPPVSRAEDTRSRPIRPHVFRKKSCVRVRVWLL